MADSKTFGYIRVSSKDQNLDRQLDTIRKYVADDRDILADKQSGKDFNRPQYQALKSMLRGGDTLYIHSLDRLGRNKEKVKEEIQWFYNNGIIVRILDIPTTLMDYKGFGTMQKTVFDMVNNILIEVLATIAEAERDNIHKRQAEGIASAKKKGRKFGRPVIPLPDSFEEDYKDWKAGKVTAVALYRDKYHISRAGFYIKVRQYEAAKKLI